MDICINTCNSIHSKVPWFELIFSLHLNKRQNKSSYCRINMQRYSIALTNFGNLWYIIHLSMRILRCWTYNYNCFRTNRFFEMLYWHSFVLIIWYLYYIKTNIVATFVNSRMTCNTHNYLTFSSILSISFHGQ